MTTDHLQEARDLVLRAETSLERDVADDAVDAWRPHMDLLAAQSHAWIDIAATLRRIADAIPPDPPAPAAPVASAAPARYAEDLPY